MIMKDPCIDHLSRRMFLPDEHFMRVQWNEMERVFRKMEY